MFYYDDKVEYLGLLQKKYLYGIIKDVSLSFSRLFICVKKARVEMGGFFATSTKRDCVEDIFFGLDYHSHLGTKYGGMVVYDEEKGFQRQIHTIDTTPFRTKFNKDLNEFHGNSGIGCISDTDPQPLVVRSHLGLYAITTVGIITNTDAIVDKFFKEGKTHFMTMSSGKINSTELVAAIINEKDTLVEGIRHAQEIIEGSMTMLILTEDGRILAARDRLGRLPVIIGKSEYGYCATFESFAFMKLGYEYHSELGPMEIVSITADGVEQLAAPGEEMKICAFLWTYYGYPSATYEGKNVVVMKNFLEPEDDLVAFNGVGESSLERDKELYQYTYEDITAMLRENMKSTNVEETIDRFWDMFIVDALIDNFDRHGGNWGFIKKDNQYRIAPVYDNGSSLYPKLNTDEKLEAVLSSEEEIDQRIYKFPTSHIKVKNRKSSYFEVISSLQFEACNDALKRIVPRIDFNQINALIDDVEGISEVRKRFYKVMLQQRYEKILMYAYRQL